MRARESEQRERETDCSCCRAGGRAKKILQQSVDEGLLDVEPCKGVLEPRQSSVVVDIVTVSGGNMGAAGVPGANGVEGAAIPVQVPMNLPLGSPAYSSMGIVGMPPMPLLGDPGRATVPRVPVLGQPVLGFSHGPQLIAPAGAPPKWVPAAVSSMRPY